MNRPGDQLVESSAGALQTLGKTLLSALYSVGQSLKLYPLENTAVQNALDELQRAARDITQREQIVELRLVGDFLFLNDARLRLDLSNYLTLSFLSAAFARHGIGSIEIDQQVTREEWAPFLSLVLKENAEKEGAFQRFTNRLAGTPVQHIKVMPEQERAQLAAEDDQAKEAAKRTYAQSVEAVKGVLTDVRLARAVNVRRVKRAVQTIVDQVLNNESSMLGMTVLRDYDEYTFTHCVNVCIFSIVLGQKLGLSKVQLYELGLGALFHDIGKMRISTEVTNKTSGLSEAEWQEMQKHPTEGLISLFSMHGFPETPYRAMLMAYEHHMKVDLTGYPKNKRPRKPGLFSRIVAVADGFDAATSKRSYQSQPWPPDEVLKEMRDNPKRGYDQLLVKAFMNVTGVYPVGTLVILDTHEMAVVVKRNPDPRFVHQPFVKVITTMMGMPIPNPEINDLAETDPATGNPKRTIIKTTDAEKYGIDVAQYFV